MRTPTYFFVAATASGELRAGISTNLEKTMFALGDRPIRTRKGLLLFEKLVYVEEHPGYFRARMRQREFEKMSPLRRIEFINQANPNWEDLSADWFPVFAMPGTNGDWPFGETSGGIGARLQPRVPPREDTERLDPLSRMSREDLVACGAFKTLQVGPEREQKRGGGL